MTKDELIEELGNLAIRFSKGWHEGIKIDASDIMLFNQIAEALAQEQEPVKMVAYNCFCGRTMKFESVHGVVAPQRTFVGLTDEEIAQGCKESWVTEQAWQSAVWWAEEKLKEKNT